VAKYTFKKCLGVDIGTTSVKLTEVELERTGVKVSKMLHAPLPPFPDAEAAEIGTAKIIRDMVKDNNIKTREAVFCLPGQQIFTRRVRLPDASEERLMRIINYEAKQQIPFPEDKTQIETQIFRFPDEEDVEVLMVAARKDQVATYMRLVNRTGLKPIGLSVSSLSLFNYYAFDLMPFERETTKKKKKKKSKISLKKGKKSETSETEAIEEEQEFLDEDDGEEFVMEEVRGFLNIGETYTDLIIGRKGKTISLAFVRSIPIAGREFSKIIQNSMGIEDPNELAALKHNRVMAISMARQIPEGTHNYDEGASMAVTDVVESRLAKQIQLSLDFFIAQPDGMAVDSLDVTGGSAALEGIGDLLEDRLALPCTVVDSPSNEAVTVENQPDAPFGEFAVSLGAAMGGIEVSPISINFLPESVKTSLVFPRVEVAILAVLIGVMVFLSSQVGTKFIQVHEESANQMTQQANQLRGTQQQITQAVEKRTKVKTAIESFVESVDVQGRDYIVDFYTELVKTVRSATPLAVITYIDVSPHGKMELVGRSTNSTDAPDLKRALDGLDKFVEEITLVDNTRNPAVNEYFFRITGEVINKKSRISTPRPDPEEVQQNQVSRRNVQF
jgi:type IV pilus assembly protein PilM